MLATLAHVRNMNERDERTEGLIATALLLAASVGLLLVAGLGKIAQGFAENEDSTVQLNSAPAGLATFGAACLLLLAWALLGPPTPRWPAPRWSPPCAIAVLVLPLVGARHDARTA